MTGVEKALKRSVVLLAGDESVLRRRALSELLEGVGSGPDDFDLQELDAQSSRPAEWAAAAGTAPFLSERRVVIVRHLLLADPDGVKGGELDKLPETALLILVADEEASSDERAQRLKTVRKNWIKKVEDAHGVALVFDPDPKAAKEAVKREVQARGKKISDRASDMLVEMTGGGLSRALEELDKLVLYSGDADQIGEREVRIVVMPSREWSVFKMADAIVSNRVAEALRQLRILVGSASKAEEAAFRSILPQLSRSLRLIWQARLCIEDGCPPGSPSDEVMRMLPARPNLSTEQPYRQGPLMSIARKTTLPGIASALQVLADTDARLKGGLPSFSAIDSLELMVMEMAAALAGE